MQFYLNASIAVGVVGKQRRRKKIMISQEAMDILTEERGLDEELLAKLGIRSKLRHGGEWIAIPFIKDGQVVNHKYRTISGQKKMSQDADAVKCFWNFDILTDKTLVNMPLVITEGELDAITAIQCGFTRAVSVPDGAPSERISDEDSDKYNFLDDAMPLIDDCKEIIIAVDGDDAGKNLLHDLSWRLGRTRCKFVKYPAGCKDINEVLVKHGAEAVKDVLRGAEWIKISGKYKMSELPPMATPEVISTGLTDMDAHYKIRWGDFCVVTGVPSHGKTSVVNDICFRVAEREKLKVCFASFEQNPVIDHKRNMIKWYKGEYNQQPSIEDCERWIDERFVFMYPDENEDVDLDWVLDVASAAVVQDNCKIVVIDPWNEIDHVRPKNMSLTEYVGFAIKQFKKFAKRHQIHLIVVAHPSKAIRYVKGNPVMPTLYDISDSAHWYNKADVGIVVHREKNLTKVQVAKSRYHDIIGKPATKLYSYNNTLNRFDIAEE